MNNSARIISLEELEPGADDNSKPLAGSGALQALLQVRARVDVRVGGFEMRVADLLDARVDQIVTLDSTVDQAVDLLVEGQVVARGQLMAVGDHFAVRILTPPATEFA